MADSPDNVIDQPLLDPSLSNIQTLYNRHFVILACLARKMVREHRINNPTTLTRTPVNGDMYYVPNGSSGTDWADVDTQYVIYVDDQWIEIPASASMGPFYSLDEENAGALADWYYRDGVAASPVAIP